MKRKTLLFISVAVISSNLLQAQIKKGSLLLGGQISFNNTKSKIDDANNDRRQTSFNISPAVGRAIKDNLVAGVDAFYSHSRDKTENINLSGLETNGLGAGVFIRQYVPIVDRLYLFGQGRLGASYAKSDNNSFYGSYYYTKEFNATIGFYPGISFAVNRKIHLESGFANLVYAGYSHKKTEESTQATHKISRSDNFSIGSSLDNQSGFTLGVRVLLAR